MIKQIVAGIWLFITAGFVQAQAPTIFVDGFEDYCALTFTDLPTGDWYNGSVCANGTNCVSATITITVAQGGDCTGISSVGLFDGESQLAMDSNPPVGGVSVFSVLIDDGAALQLEAKAFESTSEIASSGVFPRKADFTLPHIEWDFKASYNSFDDLAPETPGMQFHAEVEVADANVDGGQLISFTATGTSTVDLVPSNVTIPLTLIGATPVVVNLLDMTLADQQQHLIRVAGTDAAGNQGSVEHTAYVDLLDPEGTIIAPVDNVILSNSDDADLGEPGFQLSVTFATSLGATHWALTSQAGCDSTHNNCDSPVTKASGAVTNPDGEETATLITLDLSGQNSYHRIGLVTEDPIGNQDFIDARITVSFNCGLGFTDLPPDWYSGSVCDNGSDCSSATVTITVAQIGNCTGISSVGLFDGESLLATDYSPPFTGVSVFNVLIEDGTELQLQARAFESDSEIASTGVYLIKTDFTLPQVEFTAADVEGFQTAATGEHAVYTIFSDLDPGIPGMQIHARVSVADTNVDGGQLSSLTATGASTVDLNPSNVSIPLTLSGATPLAVDLLYLTLAEQQTHVISVVGTDAAGNQGSASYTAEVDLTEPPDPPTLLETSPPMSRTVREP